MRTQNNHKNEALYGFSVDNPVTRIPSSTSQNPDFRAHPIYRIMTNCEARKVYFLAIKSGCPVSRAIQIAKQFLD